MACDTTLGHGSNHGSGNRVDDAEALLSLLRNQQTALLRGTRSGDE